MTKAEKFDVLNLLFKSYFLNLLNALKGGPKRFSELRKHVPNDMTLSAKLKQLKAYGLVEVVPIKFKENYVNSYALSRRGKKTLEMLAKV